MGNTSPDGVGGASAARILWSLPAYSMVATVLFCLRWLPRGVARTVGARIAGMIVALRPAWRRYAEKNLRLAFPGMTPGERAGTFRRAVQSWGWMLAEFARFPRYTPGNIGDAIEVEEIAHYQTAAAAGKGVLFLTAHLGAWELSSFAHSLNGYPLAYLNRPLDNPLLDRLVTRYRCLGGNRSIDRANAARAVIEELRAGRAVGFLLDQNVVEGQGQGKGKGNVFADFFSVPASTTTGLARFAQKTGAPVVPGFATWNEVRGKYVLRFEPPVELVKTGNEEADLLENTARFNRVIERAVRRHPGQWLWVHRRWRTRPPGEPSLYED